MLDTFITDHRDAIISHTRAKVAARSAPPATAAELEHGVPLFLDELGEMLRNGEAPRQSPIGESARLRGAELLKIGLGVGQVVHDYGNICQAITELAVECGAPITPNDFRLLNAALDEAIARAVIEHGRQREDAITAEGVEHLGSLAHEMRNLVSTAMLAFGALRTGQVGVDGTTGALLGRSLGRMGTLIDRSLVEVRLEAGTLGHERVQLATLLREVEIAVTLEVAASGVRLAIDHGAADAAVDADAQVLTAAVVNLVQNACRFTPPGGHVAVRSHATAARVTIDVEDACGGLARGQAEALFRPLEHQDGDRTGLGRGLVTSRKGIAALGGELRVRDVPGTGCVFTIDLPRAS